jgi:hypothetical protein
LSLSGSPIYCIYVTKLMFKLQAYVFSPRHMAASFVKTKIYTYSK